MKIKAINYVYGGMALELIAEGEIEYMVLKELWKHGEMERGNGDTATPEGLHTGFYLKLKDKQKTTP